MRSTGWLLTKILGDDVVTDAHGEPQIGEGTAPDRIISVTDPETLALPARASVRHGHKSKAQRFDGFKTAVATEVASELILDIADLPASCGDGEHLMPTIGRVEEHAGISVGRVIGDGAYPSGENLAACAIHAPAPVDLVGPLARPTDPAVAKSAFQIDFAARRATCPGGHTVAGTPARLHGRAALEYRFPRQTCEPCRWFVRCVQGQVQGRTVRTDAFDPYRHAARRRQATPEFRDLYRTRSRVERKQAELVHHGLRRTRYVSPAKRQLQRFWTAAAVNLKRLFKLIEEAQRDLRAIFQRGVPRVPSLAAR